MTALVPFPKHHLQAFSQMEKDSPVIKLTPGWPVGLFKSDQWHKNRVLSSCTFTRERPKITEKPVVSAPRSDNGGVNRSIRSNQAALWGEAAGACQTAGTPRGNFWLIARSGINLWGIKGEGEQERESESKTEREGEPKLLMFWQALQRTSPCWWFTLRVWFGKLLHLIPYS